jgi:transcriptional regulator with XRE-family HTH domain
MPKTRSLSAFVWLRNAGTDTGPAVCTRWNAGWDILPAIVSAASAAIARAAYELRTKARLSQDALARRIGVATGAIANLEDDDFEGDARGLLQRIATALNKTVEIRVVPRKVKRHAAQGTEIGGLFARQLRRELSLGVSRSPTVFACHRRPHLGWKPSMASRWPMARSDRPADRSIRARRAMNCSRASGSSLAARRRTL